MGSWDPERSGDALPVHRVRLSAFYLAKYLTTNQDFLAFLNDGISRGQLEVREGVVYASGGVDAYAFTREYAYAYSLGFDGSDFSILDFRASHPVVGVQWRGAAAYCNWLSEQKGLSPCYDLGTGACDFTRNGYRLPTEAEWEYAARAGQADPLADPASGASLEGPVRLPGPGPFQGAGPSTYPWTTPVGFFDGSLRYRSDFRWPGTATAYQTANAANGFGLFDMQGNVWQFVQDWYLGNDYGQSPSADPRGPDTGSLMPDGSTCHVLRGGSWFGDRGLRVSDRQPAYFRGALGPKLSWCLVGFRVARNAAPLALHRGVSF
jgi:formylglycine-generating enzyme required for sulfatase activity